MAFIAIGLVVSATDYSELRHPSKFNLTSERHVLTASTPIIRDLRDFAFGFKIFTAHPHLAQASTDLYILSFGPSMNIPTTPSVSFLARAK